jgi:adenylate cyclase
VWGYDDAFMALTSAALSVREAEIEAGDVWVAEAGGCLAGVVALGPAAEPDALDLAKLFIAPGWLRRGIGRALLAYAVAEAGRRGARRLTILSDPNAAGFYERSGATRIGEAPSDAVPGRALPLYEMRLDPPPAEAAGSGSLLWGRRVALRPRTTMRLRIVAGVTVLAAALGGAFALRSALSFASVGSGLLAGGVNGALLSSLEILLQGRARERLRRLPVLAALGLRTVLYSAVFVLGTMAAASFLRLVRPRGGPPGSITLDASYLLLFIAASLVFNFAFLLRRLIGGRTLLALLSGRYRRPKYEERIVLFLDLEGSTELAERLGDEGFHRFLNQVFFDLTDPVLDAGGEIYRYVGDEVIVTWPLAKGMRDAAALSCVFAIEEALARRRGDYERLFGAAPHLRAALHAGPLIVGEMGDIKREIVMIGDTMNTAARIEEACRTTGRDFIVSGAARESLRTLPPGICVEPLGPMPLRGKQAELELFALTRTVASERSTTLFSPRTRAAS